MEDKLIEFETAKLAKEKGFDVVQDYVYNQYEENDNTELEIECVEFSKEELERYITFKEYTKCWLCPTQSLLQRWLREVHNLNVEVNNYGYNKKDKHFSFRCSIRLITKIENKLSIECKSKIEQDWFIFRSYEEALEEALLESLKLIK
jgi:hypothetical protein